MKRAGALAIVPFAWMMIGADDCALTQIGQPVPPASNKPFCLFDPPAGCKAFCTDVGAIGFTSQCDNVSASTLTVQFKNIVGNRVIQAVMAGQPFCTQDGIDNNINTSVTPCQVGITPQPNPPESQDVCMNPLPGCVQW